VSVAGKMCEWLVDAMCILKCDIRKQQ
jgi:hypothetical protein